VDLDYIIHVFGSQVRFLPAPPLSKHGIPEHLGALIRVKTNVLNMLQLNSIPVEMDTAKIHLLYQLWGWKKSDVQLVE
jgi:hypothetical protein